MNVPFADFTPMHKEISDDILSGFKTVYEKGIFISGENCSAFEREFAEYCGTDYCVGCGNGLDALRLILLGLGIGAGDEVIVPAQTFIATALAVSYCGAKPVFVDIEPDYYSIDPNKLAAAITEKTKAVILVHLYGQPGHVAEVRAIAKEHGLYIIEDSAQAHGATYHGVKTGNLGDASGFSFYPGKNLGALGDAGGVTSNSEEIAKKVRIISNYGAEKKYYHQYKGVNSRLDEVQAMILRFKLRNLDRWHEDRQRIAEKYLAGITNPLIKLPHLNPEATHAWHIFAIMCENRESLMRHMESCGIQCQIHYPVPMHLHEAYKELAYKKGDFPVAEMAASEEISLPMFYGMTDEQIDTVIEALNSFSY